MTEKDVNQHIQCLRLHLLDILRVSQRAVDYSTKAVTLGIEECSAHVMGATHEINALRCEIAKISHDLLIEWLPSESDLRFILSASRISSALHTVHEHAVKIAASSIQRAQAGWEIGSNLIEMGEIVNRFMRLCVIAVFEDQIEHAETVLRNRGVELLFFPGPLERRYRVVARWRLGKQAVQELQVASSLCEMAEQIYVIADAIAFWLKRSDCGFADQAPERLANAESLSTKDIGAFDPSSEGMPAFLGRVAEAFASRSFWNGLQLPVRPD